MPDIPVFRSTRHPADSDLNISKQKLQDVVNELAKWGLKNGLTFSATKTKVMHFKHKPGIIQSQEL